LIPTNPKCWRHVRLTRGNVTAGLNADDVSGFTRPEFKVEVEVIAAKL
jgi:hypothetical protein